MPSAAERTISTAGNDHGSGYSEDGPDFDSFSAPALSLQEHLLAQAGSAFSGQQFVIATQLIGQMDEAGYLEANLLETAYRLNVALNEVERSEEHTSALQSLMRVSSAVFSLKK